VGVRPGIATIVSGSWERALVEAARAAGTLRIVGRCETPFEVGQVIPRADAIIVGSEVPWVTAAALRRWRDAGVAVFGVVGANDRVGARIFRDGEVTQVFDAREPMSRTVAGIVASVAVRPAAVTSGTVTVTGPRGCPGRSEIAIALAWKATATGSAILVETDRDAPGTGVRLGLEPNPGLARSDPALVGSLACRRWGRIEVLTLPVSPAPLSRSIELRVLEAAVSEFDAVIVDAGPCSGPMRHDPGSVVFVMEASPVGLVRAARAIAAWAGPQPRVVLNRVEGDVEYILRSARAATGLEPSALIPRTARPDCGDPPLDSMLASLEPLATALWPDQRSAAL